MRSLSAQQAIVRDLAARGEKVRVRVKDTGGTWRDLSTYGGQSWVNSVAVVEGVDGPHMTADFAVKREFFAFSLSAFMEESGLNRGLDPDNAYQPVLALTNEVKVDVDLVPAGSPATSWVNLFHGRIDTFDVAAGDEVTVQCRDLGGLIADARIRVERVYAFDTSGSAIKGLRIFQPSTAYALNELVIPNNQTTKYYKVTTAGTSGSSEPTFPTGGTVTSGSAVFTVEGNVSTSGKAVELVMQSLLNDNMTSPPTLYVPTSPGWNITQYQQPRGPLLDALRTLAGQIGWDVRYKWRSGTSQFEFTFFSPDRAKTTPDFTFAARTHESIKGLRIAKQDIRNDVTVTYSDPADLEADGITPKRKSVNVTDAGSIASYGNMPCELAEASSSNIDTATEATAYANTVLSDLSQPTAEKEVALWLFPQVELGDLYRFYPNGKHSSTDLDLAVVSYRHEFGSAGNRTHVTCRGKPSGGHRRWLAVETRPGISLPHRFQNFDLTNVVSIAPVVGGLRVAITGARNKGSVYFAHEVHVSQTPGFVPTSATLAAITTARAADITTLYPGVTYFTKVVPIGTNDGKLVRGQPLPEASAVAGYANQFFDQPGIRSDNILINPNFDAWTRGDPSNNPPDGWDVIVGDWSDSLNYDDTVKHSGGGSIKFEAGTTNRNELRSALFAAVPGDKFFLSAWLYPVAHRDSDDTMQLEIRWYSDLTTLISASTKSFGDLTDSAWTEVILVATAPTDGVYGRVSIRRMGDPTGLGSDPSTDLEFHADDLSLTRVPAGSTPSLLNSWSNAGGSYKSAGFHRDVSGWVRLEGSVSGGTVSTGSTGRIFRLPVGMRPGGTIDFRVSTPDDDLSGTVRITSDGYVQARFGDSAKLSLDGISFRAEQ